MHMEHSILQNLSLDIKYQMATASSTVIHLNISYIFWHIQYFTARSGCPDADISCLEFISSIEFFLQNSFALNRKRNPQIRILASINKHSRKIAGK